MRYPRTFATPDGESHFEDVEVQHETVTVVRGGQPSTSGWPSRRPRVSCSRSLRPGMGLASNPAPLVRGDALGRATDHDE